MGYRSNVSLKTTTEGWVLMKKFNDSITSEDNRPLTYMNIEKTPDGFYRISNDCIKWYTDYPNVNNFVEVLDQFDEQGIPYTFIELGEDLEDINKRVNWTDDMPSEIEEYRIEREVYDPQEGEYERVTLDAAAATPVDIDYDKAHAEIFNIFDKHKYYDDIEDALQSLLSEKVITSAEYNWIQDNYNDLLKEWEENKEED